MEGKQPVNTTYKLQHITFLSKELSPYTSFNLNVFEIKLNCNKQQRLYILLYCHKIIVEINEEIFI